VKARSTAVSNQKAYDNFRKTLSCGEIRVGESLIMRGAGFLQDVVDAISRTPDTELDAFDPVHHAKGIVSVGNDTLTWKITEISNDNTPGADWFLLEVDLFPPLSKRA